MPQTIPHSLRASVRKLTPEQHWPSLGTGQMSLLSREKPGPAWESCRWARRAVGMWAGFWVCYGVLPRWAKKLHQLDGTMDMVEWGAPRTCPRNEVTIKVTKIDRINPPEY